MTRPTMVRTAPICLLVLAVFSLSSAAQDKPTKVPVPAKEALEKSEKTIRSVFQAEYAKRRPAEMQELGTKLFNQALETTDDDAARYVLLREAADLTARAGDYQAAFKAIDEMDRLYTVNMPQLKLTALEASTKVVGSGPN